MFSVATAPSFSLSDPIALFLIFFWPMASSLILFWPIAPSFSLRSPIEKFCSFWFPIDSLANSLVPTQPTQSRSVAVCAAAVGTGTTYQKPATASVEARMELKTLIVPP